jgi:hypothetical protein
MIPSISAWAKRNHGQQPVASQSKHLRTGLETFWYDCAKQAPREKAHAAISHRYARFMIIYARFMIIKESGA